MKSWAVNELCLGRGNCEQRPRQGPAWAEQKRVLPLGCPALLFFHWFLANRCDWICDLAKGVLLQFKTWAQLLDVMELGFALPFLSLGIQCCSDYNGVGQLFCKGPERRHCRLCDQEAKSRVLVSTCITGEKANLHKFFHDDTKYNNNWAPL